jgi:hypothetical protein
MPGKGRIGDQKMADAGIVRATSDRVSSPRTIVMSICVCIFIFIYYWALLSDGRFQEVEPVRYGLVFNSMIDYLSRGRFDVDPDIVLKEGFFRGGHTYAYFGPVPALLRLPLLIWPRFGGVDFTVISCAIAATLATVANVGAVLQARRVIAGGPYVRRISLFAMAVMIFGGPQLQFLRPSIFQESLYWAAAIAAIFVMLAFRWCIDIARRRSGHLITMALLAGLCLLTRVSTSIGLYAACGGIMLAQLIAAAQRDRASIIGAVRMLVLPSLILLSCMVIVGYINYERWGSPLTFQDYKYYNSMLPDDPVFGIIAKYGYFNFRRLLFGLSYFFVPVWTIIGSDGHFLFHAFMDRVMYIVELPPATFLASDTFLCFLACLGFASLWRRRAAGTDTLTARLIAAGFAIPAVLILIAIALTFRYRMEFYPLFEFLGLFGLISLATKFTSHPRLFTNVCGLMVVISIVSSHAFLFAYKMSPWGYSLDVEKTGWAAAYREYLHIKYPGLERHLESPPPNHGPA